MLKSRSWLYQYSVVMLLLVMNCAQKICWCVQFFGSKVQYLFCAVSVCNRKSLPIPSINRCLNLVHLLGQWNIHTHFLQKLHSFQWNITSRISGFGDITSLLWQCVHQSFTPLVDWVSWLAVVNFALCFSFVFSLSCFLFRMKLAIKFLKIMQIVFYSYSQFTRK
jgi:hypothetical protein